MSRPITASSHAFNDTFNNVNISNSALSSRPNTADYSSINQKKIKRYSNSTSSIPGRYPDRKAKKIFKKPSFGCSSKRFECSTTNLPGPGYYSPDIVSKTSLLAEGPSFPKGGYGNAFLSKVKKLNLIGGIYDIPGCRNKPGPGEYYKEREPDGREIKFTTSGKGRVPFDDLPKTPSSFDYYPQYKPGSPKLLLRKESATFCSNSEKIPNPYMTDAPGIGKYTLPDDIAHVNTFAWSKSSHKRFQDFGKDNHVPSPTRYFSDEPVHVDNHRNVGAFKGPYLGKQNETPSAALHTFGADKDRFKHSFCGRLDLKANEPGPLDYVLPDFAKEVESKPNTGAASFRSKSPLRESPPSSPAPGVLYYKPELYSPKSLAQSKNPDGRWI